MPHEASTSIAVRSSWKTEPLGPVTRIPYIASFSHAQSHVLRRGLVPQEMEDKWFVFWEDDSLFFHRSWTGCGIYQVTFRPSTDGIDVSMAVVADAYRRDTEREEVALLDFLIRGLLLREDVYFPVPTGLRYTAGIYQHHVAGTAFPERSLDDHKRSGLLEQVISWLRRM